jgi:hypothetical protein
MICSFSIALATVLPQENLSSAGDSRAGLQNKGALYGINCCTLETWLQYWYTITARWPACDSFYKRR